MSSSSNTGAAFTPTYNPDKIFWAKVDKSGGPDACWPFTGYVTPEGYGWAYTGLPKPHQQTHGAHRQAWILTHGPIQKELLICHHCDYPRCCNPKHLFVGTVRDNHVDMRKKDRHNRKLSSSQAREILALKGSGVRAADLSQRYGVGAGVVQGIWAGRSWHHIQPPEATLRRKKGRPPTGKPKGPKPRVTWT